MNHPFVQVSTLYVLPPVSLSGPLGYQIDSLGMAGLVMVFFKGRLQSQDFQLFACALKHINVYYDYL